MSESQLDWGSSYAVPAGLRFRLTPAGSFQADDERIGELAEVASDQIELLLGFARSQVVETAFEKAAMSWDVDRETYGRLLETWIATGLLRRAKGESNAPTRLALFASAMAEHAATASGRFPLRSQFKLQEPGMFYPGLETREIHDRRRFPWVAALESAFPVVETEFAALLASADFSRVNPGYTSKGEWAAAYLWAFGEKVDEVLAFAELEEFTVRLLESDDAVRSDISRRFEHVLMDELQDTNRLQWKLIGLVRRRNFFAVGDINQSIYGFRHAQPEIFHEYEAGINSSGKHSVQLLHNFRSRNEILRCVESVLNDAEGIIRWSYVSPIGINPGADGILKALTAMTQNQNRPAGNRGAGEVAL